MTPRVHRYRDLADLGRGITSRMMATMADVQRRQSLVQLCLCGGRTANALFEESVHHRGENVDVSRLEIWWSDERFLPTESPDRYAGQALSILGGSFPLSTARMHLMPAKSEQTDVADAALGYAVELGDTRFDVCLLSLGANGTVASLPESGTDGTELVIGVPPTETEPWERITLTTTAINRSREVWIFASGEAKADAVARALSGDPTLPASGVSGVQATHWFVDNAAARHLPYFTCAW